MRRPLTGAVPYAPGAAIAKAIEDPIRSSCVDFDRMVKKVSVKGPNSDAAIMDRGHRPRLRSRRRALGRGIVAGNPQRPPEIRRAQLMLDARVIRYLIPFARCSSRT